MALVFRFAHMLLYFMLLLTSNNADALKNCPVVQRLEGTMYKGLKFSALLPQNAAGFSVEFIFNDPVNVTEVNDASNNSVTATGFFGKHWIISVPRLSMAEVKKAELTLRYSNDDGDELVGVILNGDQVLCGEGVSKVFSSSYFPFEGTKECKPTKITRYEHESVITITEEFVSERIGLVVDVVFDSDIDSLEDSNLFPKKLSGRHYSLFNSGYITSKDKLVEVLFKILHTGKKTPRILAVVMNDVVICGFAPTLIAFNDQSLISVSKILEENMTFLSFNNLITSSVIFSVFALLTALVAGLAVWKLAFPQHMRQSQKESAYDEPIYAKPK